jgi:hypothetical protein
MNLYKGSMKRIIDLSYIYSLMEEIQLKHITSTVEFKLVSDIKLKLFDSFELDIQPYSRIARVHSTYFDKIFLYEEYFEKMKKKKTKKTYKKRRAGEDKTAFDSQIEISIVALEDVDKTLMKTKIYKIKVFKTGKCSVPGVVKADLSDLIEPLNILKEYCSILFGCNLNIEGIRSVTGNYTADLRGSSSTRRVWPLMRLLTPKYVSINLDALYEYLCCPDIDWNSVSEIRLDMVKLNEVVGAFTSSTKKKSEKRCMNSIKMTAKHFEMLIRGEALAGIYRLLIKKFGRMKELYPNMPNNSVMTKLAGLKIRYFIDNIHKIMLEDHDEIFPYLDDDITKTSVMYNGACIVIHSSGAVSIYGVNNQRELKKISIFLTNLYNLLN